MLAVSKSVCFLSSCLQSAAGKSSEFVLEPHLDQINTLFAAETLEEIFDRLNKDGSEWAKCQLETLKKMVRHFCMYMFVSSCVYEITDV